MRDFYKEGFEAYYHGVPRSKVKEISDSWDQKASWVAGWEDAEEDADKEIYRDSLEIVLRKLDLTKKDILTLIRFIKENW
jgi:ribosome modulation factor